MKKYLFILQQAPFASSLAEEAVELILAVSAFEQKISILFSESGVLQLIKSEGFTKTFAGLPLFGITDIYLQAGCLEQHNIKINQLSIQPQIVDSYALNKLIDSHDIVLRL